MKKKATVLIASIMAFCGINTAHADEGMWTIYNLPNAAGQNHIRAVIHRHIVRNIVDQRALLPHLIKHLF